MARGNRKRHVGALAEKVVADKFAGLVDACYPTASQKVTDAATRASLFPYSKDPRMAAGGPLTDDIFKCALKPVTTSDYTTTLTTPQLDALKAAFPDGVCDWSQRGVGQQARAGTWFTYPRP